MGKIFIFGHKNPDTDSVTSAIALSYLKNIDKKDTIPCVLGEINNETKFVLDYFKVDKPIYLNDTKLQISDVKYNKGCFLNFNCTLKELHDYMTNNQITGVPISDDNNKYYGLINMRDLTKIIIDPDYNKLYSSYDNILKTIKGRTVTRFNDEIIGKINDTQENISSNDIIITDKDNIIKESIESNIKLLIITKEVEVNIKDLATKHKVNVIMTKLNINKVNKLIIQSNYLKGIVEDKYIEVLDTMYINDFIIMNSKYKYIKYPVINKNRRILGLLRSEKITEVNRKKVILVDHNEYSQSVEGIEEADILEVVDHHKIGSITSNEPINIRNMAVGSTNTIIYEMYKEQGIKPPKEIAGIMMAGIISDTLLFNSPTTTELDKKAVEDLSKLSHTEPQTFANKMFTEAASTKGLTIEETIYKDFKGFFINNYKIGIGQMMVINYKEVLNEKEKYLEVIEKIAKEQDYNIFMFCITDVINSNTYILYNNRSELILETSLDIDDVYQGYCLKGVVSRKKQIIPKLMDELN